MVRIRPFQAIRPQPQAAVRVASLPYDVVSREEARRLAKGQPDSFLHVVRSEIDLPPETPPDDAAVYARARANFDRLVAERVLVRDETPGLYLYRQVLNHKPQVGLVCCCHLGDYESGAIRRHEKTRPDKEDDRTRHTLALNANAGPVFLAFRDDRAVARLMAEDMNDRPLYHFDATDGVTHSAWAVKPEHHRAYVQAFAAMPTVYVADGHHRAASAARAARTRAEANPQHAGDEEYNWFLTVLFPAGDLTILPYNRLVRGMNGHAPAEVVGQLGELGQVERDGPDRPRGAGAFCAYLDGRWHHVTIDPATVDRSDPIGSLDVDLLQRRVLEPIFGIDDPRTHPGIDFVGGVRGTEALRRQVDEGSAAAAFSLHPTSMGQLIAVADAGLIMPPKSTWFEPKLRSGLFVHGLD